MSSSNNGSDWCTIESDPGVFTELLESVGVPHIELTELWSMDDDSLTFLKQAAGRIHGLIFLFKWKPGTSTSTTTTTSTNRTPLDEIPEGLFFAHQTTTNACATQALLSVVLNAPQVELGETLKEFKSFTSDFPPSLKGEAIGASDKLKQAHNSFARKDHAFLAEGKTHLPTTITGDEDVFHFVAYIPFQDGNVYELDGLQKGPIVIGSTTTTTTEDDGSDWLTVARTAIQERMTMLGHGEIKFNLLAVMDDKRVVLETKLETLEKESAEYAQVQAELHQEQAKREQWKYENERRRHNYVPLVVQLLKELARNGSLPQLTTEANERVQEKRNKTMTKS